MAGQTQRGRRTRIGAVALVGAGLLISGLGGMWHGSGATGVAHASTVITAGQMNVADDGEDTPTAEAGNQGTGSVAATATPEENNGDHQGAATPEATSVPNAAATANPTATSSDQGGEGDNTGDHNGGSGDQGVSDEGMVHDGQSGQGDESNTVLQQQETNQVDAGTNTFINETTAAQNAPQVDR